MPLTTCRQHRALSTVCDRNTASRARQVRARRTPPAHMSAVYYASTRLNTLRDWPSLLRLVCMYTTERASAQYVRIRMMNAYNCAELLSRTACVFYTPSEPPKLGTPAVLNSFARLIVPAMPSVHARNLLNMQGAFWYRLFACVATDVTVSKLSSEHIPGREDAGRSLSAAACVVVVETITPQGSSLQPSLVIAPLSRTPPPRLCTPRADAAT